MISFDAELVPELLRARTRTKYRPGPAGPDNVGDGVLNTPTSLAPVCRPASTSYDVAPEVAFQLSVTIDPLTDDRRPAGASGPGPDGSPIQRSNASYRGAWLRGCSRYSRLPKRPYSSQREQCVKCIISAPPDTSLQSCRNFM